MSQPVLAVLIFIAAYLGIVTERLHKTVVALLGASLMMTLGVVSQEEAFYSRDYGIDYNVVFLLIGMMVIVNITRKTGLFEATGIWAAKRAGARPFPMMALLATLTALLSALLDNVTTVLLMGPVTLAITKRLELSPVPFLIAEALASNLGGTATLVGDPPNIMIASKAELSFLDFLVVLGPAVVTMMVVFLGALWLINRRTLAVSPQLQADMLALRPADAIRDYPLLRGCLILLALTTVGFCLHGLLHLEPATVALLGASLFMLIGHVSDKATAHAELDYLTDVEWKTIFFFIGLFILVGGLLKGGVIQSLAKSLLTVTNGHTLGTTVMVLWGSALLSAIVDNIPYVAAMNPLIVELARTLHPDIADYSSLVHHPDILPLWWALALGACLGGNGTIIGATANVIIGDLAARAGHPISFWRFLRVGVPTMVGSIMISTAYLWIVFFAL